jgi:hypothetical protein
MTALNPKNTAQRNRQRKNDAGVRQADAINHRAAWWCQSSVKKSALDNDVELSDSK